MTYRKHEYPSPSEIKYLIEGSPRKYYYNKFEREKESLPEGLGTYFHTAILEPEKLKDYKVIPEMDKRTKAGKAVYEEFLSLLEAGEKVVEQKTVDRIQPMIDRCLQEPLIRKIKGSKNIVIEQPIISDALKMKGCPDIVLPNEGMIFDFKTNPSDPKGFKKMVWMRKYHIQAYMYSLLCKEKYDKDFTFYFIPIEPEPPHEMGIYELSSEIMDIAEKQIIEAHRIWQECHAKNEWLYRPLKPLKIEMEN